MGGAIAPSLRAMPVHGAIKSLTHHSSVLSLTASLAFSFQLCLRPLDEPVVIYLWLSFQIPSPSQQSRAASPDEILEISYKGFNTAK